MNGVTEGEQENEESINWVASHSSGRSIDLPLIVE